MNTLRAPQIIFVDFQYLTLVQMCIIWVYFKVSKMTLRLTFPWNAPSNSSQFGEHEILG